MSAREHRAEHGSDDLLEEVNRLITALESHPDAQVGAQLHALLEGIDAVHRAGLTRLLESIRAMAGEAFVNRLTADPAVRLLLMSYELIAVDRRLLADEALDAVRGHLHAHGIEVELTEVVGGVVYLRLHGPGRHAVPEALLRRDLEEALRAGLLGFQELVIGAREDAHPPRLVQLGGARKPRRPVYRDALEAASLEPGQVRGVEVEGDPVLIANVGGEWLAVADRCGDGPLPLHFGTLQGAELRCSWHGCRYDLRTGKRLDGGTERLRVYPVAVEAGTVRVAVDVEPAS